MTKVITFKVDEKDQSLVPEQHKAVYFRHPTVLLFLTRATRDQLQRELIPGEIGISTIENRMYYKHRETGKLLFVQMEEEAYN